MTVNSWGLRDCHSLALEIKVPIFYNCNGAKPMEMNKIKLQFNWSLPRAPLSTFNVGKTHCWVAGFIEFFETLTNGYRRENAENVK